MDQKGITLIGPEQSVRIEQEFETLISDRVGTTALTRVTELDRQSASDRVVMHCHCFVEPQVVVWLCHFPDLMFYLLHEDFAAAAFQLVEFDGDTVYAMSSDMKKGVGLDMYRSEISDETRFTVDSWGL